MDIDETDSDVDDVNILKERSELMDKRVLNKQQQLKDEELKIKMKQDEEKGQKKRNNDIRFERMRVEKKQKKQKVKDTRKKKKKKETTDKIRIGPNNKVLLQIPNLKKVPENCKHLVNQDDVLYVVTGDGCCGPNCAAAFLFGDEVYGPKLRRLMNIFFASHWEDRYKYITQCSEDHPYVRKLGGGGGVSFTEPLELIKYLKTSEEAAFMWSDSEDLAIISDMYQIKIKVITTRGLKDENPTENWIYPDVKLKKVSEFSDVEINDMTLLHENDCHFNLVISKESDLAKKGSLSYRFNVGPLLNDTKDAEVSEEEMEVETDTESMKTDKMKDMEKKLKESEASKNLIKSEYLKCEKELRKKVEETEKLKTEIKDLKEILKMQNQLEENDLESSVNEEESEKYEKVKRNRKPRYESSPAKSRKKKEEEFNCMECFFQGTEEMELKNHIDMKHKRDRKDDGLIRRRICDEEFLDKWNLMVHRKNKHAANVAQCRNNLEGICSYADNMCWWSHSEIITECITCFICGETFKSKTDMMRHRKIKHSDRVRPCSQFSQNNCRFKSESCWFQHEKVTEIPDDNINEHNVNNDNLEKVFRKVSEDLDPPIANQRKSPRNQEDQREHM